MNFQTVCVSVWFFFFLLLLFSNRVLVLAQGKAYRRRRRGRRHHRGRRHRRSIHRNEQETWFIWLKIRSEKTFRRLTIKLCTESYTYRSKWEQLPRNTHVCPSASSSSITAKWLLLWFAFAIASKKRPQTHIHSNKFAHFFLVRFGNIVFDTRL